MIRCDECKYKGKCVCVPYGCECFELDLEEHDKQIRADAIDKFVDKFIKRTQLRQMTKSECINTMYDLAEQLKENL